MPAEFVSRIGPVYVLAAGVISFSVGIFLGIILRGVKARRQVERLSDELRNCQDQLTAVAQSTSSTARPTAPARWTGAEIAAVLGAFGTLCGALGTVYGSYQGRELTTLKFELAKAQSEAVDVTKATGDVLRYPTSDWQLRSASIPAARKKGTLDVSLDNRETRGDCRTQGVVLTYSGTKPAVLHCSPGAVSLQLDKPTKLLFVDNTP